MTATILPFTRTVAAYPAGPCAAETVPAAPAPAPISVAGTTTFPADLEPLAASIFADLSMGSVFEGLSTLIDRAMSERGDHRVKPLAAIADAAVDPLMDLRERLLDVMSRLARLQALSEARDLDAAFADMPQDDQAVELGWLRPDQRKALLYMQEQAMCGGSAA